jgi:hypothetical protein
MTTAQKILTVFFSLIAGSATIALFAAAGLKTVGLI